MNESMVRVARVIDNNDDNKKSKIQVRILPELKDVKANKLPWISPKYSGSNETKNTGLHQIPEIDSLVLVEVWDWYDDMMCYLPYGDYNSGNNIYSKVSELSSISELGTQTYPQPNYFKRHEDGTIEFHNTDTGEHGVLHHSGSYVVFDKDGNITINPDSNIVELGGSSLTEFVVKGNELQTQLNTLQTKFSSLITQLQTFVFSGTPATDNPLWQSLLTVTSVLPDPSYTNILSDKVKIK